MSILDYRDFLYFLAYHSSSYIKCITVPSASSQMAPFLLIIVIFIIKSDGLLCWEQGTLKLDCQSLNYLTCLPHKFILTKLVPEYLTTSHGLEWSRMNFPIQIWWQHGRDAVKVLRIMESLSIYSSMTTVQLHLLMKDGVIRLKALEQVSK